MSAAPQLSSADGGLNTKARAAAARLKAAGHTAYWAGGCVRDLLLGRTPKDYDIATSARPDDVLALFPKSVAVGKSFGVVRGIIVRSRSIVGNIGASLQSLFGGNISLYTSLCERARDDAFRQMLAHAGELGANAVIGVRYDATEIGAGITEVLCYGTAVFVEAATKD